VRGAKVPGSQARRGGRRPASDRLGPTARHGPARGRQPRSVAGGLNRR